MHNTKCFYIGLLCLFFTSNIFSQTTIQGKILDEQGESLSYQWDQAYTSNVANFPGEIDAKSLFDLTLGFKFTLGLKLELAATNLFNNEFRALPGLPKIGRTATARLLFDF